MSRSVTTLTLESEMKLMSNELFKAVRFALYAGVTAAVGLSAGTVFAQDTGAAASGTDQSGQKLETITVTGSNIRRVDIETSNPVITIDRAAIERSGKLTLGDLIQELPAMTGGGVNPQVNNGGGSGNTGINLRGLGPARTLVLINGERTITNDPNSIPANMVERIEVLTDGASSVYGSDAIAGVVNFILRKDYQGAEFSTDYGISDHDDGVRKGYHFSFGQSSDKGSIMAGLDYNKQDEVLAGNRKFSASAIDLTGSPSTPPYTYIGGSSFPAFGRIQLTPTQAAAFGCGHVALNPGSSGQTVDTNNYHCFGNNDKFNYAAVNLDMTPNERTNLFVNGTYHLTDNVDAYLMAFHNKTSSGFQLAPALFGVPYGGTISAQSYYNPFGVDFSPSGNDFRLRLVSAGPRASSTGNTTDQVNTGLKGNFDLGSQNWTWNAGFGYGHASTTNILEGLPDVKQMNLDLGPSFNNTDPTGGGQYPNGNAPIGVVCGTPGAIIATGCTPFNPFNQFDPHSAAIIAGIAKPGLEETYQIEKYEHIDVSGGLFDLPAGTIQLAGGVSHRDEYVHSVIDPVLSIDPATGNCQLGSQCSSPLQGGYNVKEVYAEAFVPILKDLPFVHQLNLTIGDRYSKYSSFGSTSNWKIALEWRPIEDLLLRGTVSKVFRAPTIGDVFGSPISSAPGLTSDPCDYSGSGANPNAGSPACVGVPATGPFINQDVALHQQIKGISSGSKYAGFPLGPELGKSFDFGVVYDPHWLPGLSVSSDLWRLYLDNTITGVGAQSIINLCFAGLTQYCPLISRNVGGNNAGQILQILQPTTNLGRTDVSGVDLKAQYRLPEFSFGQFSAMVQASYMKSYDQQTAPGTTGNSVFHIAGHFVPFSSGSVGCPGSVGGTACTMPRWKALTGLNWQLGPFDASWQMQYIGRFRMGNPNLAEQQTAIPGIPGYYIDYGATTYNNFSFGYNLEPINTRFDVGVDNAFDKQPPVLYADTNTINANTDPGTFDLMGRYYWARVTVKF